ncbi:hypothetical protein BH23BAC3_BH23BAC3_10320 [soil metagenome]
MTAHEFWKFENLAKGITSALFTIIAGVILASQRFESGRITSGPLGNIRNLHSGHVGDYVAWLMLGAALIAAWLTWSL